MIYFINDNKYFNRYFYNTYYKYEFINHKNQRRLKYMMSGEFIL